MQAEQIKEALTVSRVADLFNLGINSGSSVQACPFCESSKSLKVYYERTYKCFKCGCKGDIFNLLEHSRLASSFSEAKRLLEQHLDSAESSVEIRAYVNRMKGMEKVFSLYKNKGSAKSKKRAEDYCLSRGWQKAAQKKDFGVATSPTQLQSGGFTVEELEKLGLLAYKEKELYDEHLVFPIRSSEGNLAHLQGRALNPTVERRWLASKGSPSIINYLYNLNNIKGSDYAVIVEGISDCQTLLEVDEPAVACFGINTPLVSHARSLRSCTHLIAIFDRDKYAIGTKQEGQYKSWSVVTPYLCELAIELKVPVYVWNVPDLPGIKDINELFVAIDYDVDIYKDMLREQAVPLHNMALEILKVSDQKHQHSQLWALHDAVSEPEELDNFEDFISSKHDNWREYLKWLHS